MTETATTHDAKRLKEIGLKGLDSLPELPAKLRSREVFSPDDPRWRKHVFRVSPKNLEHLKLLAGVPTEVTKRKSYRPALKKVKKQNLPATKAVKLFKLDAPAQQAVLDSAHNLLFGHADDKLIASAPHSTVAHYMLQAAKDLPVFAVNEIIVKDGETRVFENFATVVVDRIAVYGRGSIVLKGQVKIISKKIEYYPDQKG